MNWSGFIFGTLLACMGISWIGVSVGLFEIYGSMLLTILGIALMVFSLIEGSDDV